MITDESGSDSEASASNGSSCSSFSDFEISDELSQQGKLKKDDIISEMKPLAEVKNANKIRDGFSVFFENVPNSFLVQG